MNKKTISAIFGLAFVALMILMLFAKYFLPGKPASFYPPDTIAGPVLNP